MDKIDKLLKLLRKNYILTFNVKYGKILDTLKGGNNEMFSL